MKTVFLPLTRSRDGWTHIRSRRLLRFAPNNNIGDNNPIIRCRCGASHTWIGADDPSLPKWVDEHGAHMPALPGEPPERGIILEQDDAGQALSMRPGLRYMDGRIEVVEQALDEPPPDSSGELPDNDDLWARFHEAGFTDTVVRVKSTKPIIILVVAEEHEQRAAEFCLRHRHLTTSEAMDDLATEFERIAREARVESAEFQRGVSSVLSWLRDQPGSESSYWADAYEADHKEDA